MIQFNLLPDVKLEYIKARNMKRLVILGSAVATAVSLTVLVILFVGVNVLQRNHLGNLRGDIERDSKKLQEDPDLQKILTVQNQLHSLDPLHEAKPATERLGGYMSQLTPDAVSINDLGVDFSTQTMIIKGNSSQFRFINVFIDTLKFTKFKEGDESKSAFSNVVLINFTRNDESAEAPATYEINVQYDPTIFDNTKEITLEVPNTVTTRSSLERPSPLFQPQGEQ